MSGKKATFSVRPFDKLRKTMERHAAAAPPEAPRRKKKDEYTEDELFSSAMDGIQEIGEFRSLTCAPRHRKTAGEPVRRGPDQEALSVLGELASGLRPFHLPDTQEYVEWVNPDYHDTIISKLHGGQFSIQAFLDLHGCAVPEAEQELESFIHESFKKDLRCVKIIHGRGLRSVKGPRIKDAVIRRLSGRYRRDIIAFVTARQCDGGLGALYVLLGKKRQV
jgi:DNA-nicking Smr family endonuclease